MDYVKKFGGLLGQFSTVHVVKVLLNRVMGVLLQVKIQNHDLQVQRKITT